MRSSPILFADEATVGAARRRPGPYCAAFISRGSLKLVLGGLLLLACLHVAGSARDGSGNTAKKGQASSRLQAAGDEEGSWEDGAMESNVMDQRVFQAEGAAAGQQGPVGLSQQGDRLKDAKNSGHCKSDDGQDFDLLIHDEDRDGRVTREEFAGTQPHAQAGATNEAFACLDTDMNGYVTRDERDALKLRFFKSHLSKLNEEEVMEWLTYRKCMPTDLTKYVKRLKAAHLNGLALWEVGVKNPSLLKVEFGIVSPMQRRTIVQAICREIEGLGCLGEGQGLTQQVPGATSRGLPAGGVASENPQDQFFLSKEQGGRDTNQDGQVSKAEFTKEQGAGSAEAFSCLDPDDDGQITREEMFELKTRFFRSRLSHLTVEETRAWISSQKCVPIDMSEHLGAFRAKEINGLSLWKYGVKNPSLLRTVLGIQSEIKRATLTQAICREIEGSGCLVSNTARGITSDGSEGGSSALSWIMNFFIFASLALSIVCPLFRAKKAREVMKGSLNREAELKRGLTLSSLESMGHGALGQLRRLGAGARDVAFGGRDAGKRLGGGLKKGGGGAGGKDAGRSDSKRRFSAGHGPDRRPVLRSSASETDLDDHLVRQKYLEETGTAQRRTPGSHDRQKLSSFEGGSDGRRQSWHTDDADVDHEGLEEAINAAYPKKSAYLGPVGQRLQKGGVKRVESIRSDGSGATFMSSGTQESGGSNGSTTTGTIRSDAATIPRLQHRQSEPASSFNAHHGVDSHHRMDAMSFTAADRRSDLSMLSEEGSWPETTFESGLTKVNKKQCYYFKCKTPFSSNAIMRRLQRHKCSTCCQYFCNAHKKKKNHGCPEHMLMQNARVPREISDISINDDEFAGADDMLQFGSDDGEEEGEEEEFEDCYLGGSRQDLR